jgi:hypothetical protein
MTEYEVEIYQGIFYARILEIQNKIAVFFHSHSNFGSKIETKIETKGDWQIWYGEFRDEKGETKRLTYGFIELEQIKLSAEIPTKVRIVCCFEPLVLFWEDLAHHLRLNYWWGYLEPGSQSIAGISIPIRSILNTNSKYDRRVQSDHYAYPDPKKRLEIVKKYREAKKRGEIKNKNTWAECHYGISGRTLLEYEREFPEEL